MEQEKENQEKRKQQEQEVIRAKAQLAGLKPVGKIDLDGAKKEEKTIPAEAPKNRGSKHLSYSCRARSSKKK